MAQAVTVLIVDDHPVFRQGLEAVLGTQADLVVVAAVATGAEALSRAAQTTPDVVLLDLRLADVDGLTVLQQLHQLPKPPKVLIVSSHEGDTMITRALKLGALGYVSKNAPATELIGAIHKVQAGQRTVSTDLSSKIAQAKNLPALTPREVEIIAQVSNGLSNKQVGSVLGLTEKTVKNHLNSIFAKLEASDRTHAVMIAIERGIIGPHPAWMNKDP